MYEFFSVLLFSTIVWGQTAPAVSGGNSAQNAAANSAQAGPSLNNSENAKKARAVIDQAIAALGGQAYLTYQNKSEQGRYYPLYHGQSETTGIPYNYFTKYPDKDRLELIGRGNVLVPLPLVGVIVVGHEVKHKHDIILIHNGNKGYETTYKGTASEDPEELSKYLRRRPHSLDWVFRKWINDPSVALFDDGLAVVEGKATEQISLLNGQNDSVTLFIDQNSHLPVKSSYSWRDPQDKQRNTESEVYDNYKPVQGIMTPHSVVRYFNDDMTMQRFISTAQYNVNLPDGEFEASVNYNPLTYDPKHPPNKR